MRTELFAFIAYLSSHILFDGAMVLPVLLVALTYKRYFFMSIKLHMLSLVITRDINGGS